jgi:hypothetical protein
MQSNLIKIIVAPGAGFFITLLTVAMFPEYVKAWEIKNAFPIFVAATAAFALGGIRFREKK